MHIPKSLAMSGKVRFHVDIAEREVAQVAKQTTFIIVNLFVCFVIPKHTAHERHVFRPRKVAGAKVAFTLTRYGECRMREYGEKY